VAAVGTATAACRADGERGGQFLGRPP